VPDSAAQRPTVLAIALIVFGVIGWIAAFVLTVEKFALLADPQADISCDLSPLVQCSKNLVSWQGELFGFPNPVLGLSGWIAPIVVGAALLSGARFNRWFWLLFNVGVAGAMALVIFLISQSIFVLGTLCPWCMVTWTVTIPTFLAVTLRNLSVGVIPGGERARRIGTALYGWVPAISFIAYILIAVLAQVRLDVLGRI
jgi:uncharacterized membrane protein